MKPTVPDPGTILMLLNRAPPTLRFMGMLMIGGVAGMLLAFSLNHASRSDAAYPTPLDESTAFEDTPILKRAKIRGSHAGDWRPASPIEARFRRRDGEETKPLPARPRIAIVIDDMTADWDQVHRVSDLPGPLTLSFLPHYTALAPRIAYVKNEGHGVMLHLPMEAATPAGEPAPNPGPGALRVSQDMAEIKERLEQNLSRFSGYTGVNNHMGSRFTARIDKMIPVMKALRSRGMFFLDSVTTGSSAARAAAEAGGVPFLARDIFLDAAHDGDEAHFVRAQLRRTEHIARERGYAIAIGHPHRTTLDVLGPWLVSAYARGFEIVRIDRLVPPIPAHFSAVMASDGKEEPLARKSDPPRRLNSTDQNLTAIE